MCKRVTVRTMSFEGDANVDVNSSIEEYCTPTLSRIGAHALVDLDHLEM